MTRKSIPSKYMRGVECIASSYMVEFLPRKPINLSKYNKSGQQENIDTRGTSERSDFFSDENGPYYWHVKSGNIQREPPEAPLNSKGESRKNLIKDNDSVSRLIITVSNNNSEIIFVIINVEMF